MNISTDLFQSSSLLDYSCNPVIGPALGKWWRGWAKPNDTYIYILIYTHLSIYVAMNVHIQYISNMHIRRALAQGVSDHDFLFLLQHLLRILSYFWISSTLLQHFVRLFHNFHNFCYNCCLLFG